MLKSYYYRLLSKYISVYVRPNDRVLFVEPRSRSILDRFSPDDVLVVTTDPEEFQGYNTVDGIAEADQWQPDYIVLDGNLQREYDIIAFLEKIRSICTVSTRVILIYYSNLWRPIAGLAALPGLREKPPRENWTAPEDILNFSRLTGFERVKCQPRILLSVQIPVISTLVNRWLAPLPIMSAFCLLNMEILCPAPASIPESESDSVSVIIPLRNEAGNIEAAFQRIPKMDPSNHHVTGITPGVGLLWLRLTSARSRQRLLHDALCVGDCLLPY